MPSENAIGDYLRARRQVVAPADVGIAGGGRRRVPGLRREELAMLAGISTNYLVRLEQGRDQNPSPQVLGALSRALQLDAEATDHLHALAGPPPAVRPPAPAHEVPNGIAQLLASWHDTPAVVQNRLGTVVAANSLATALAPTLFEAGRNTVRSVFLDPAIQELFVDAARVAESAAAGLRSQAGPTVDDPELAELVGDLSIRSAEFRRLWARHEVRRRPSSGSTRFAHPSIGAIELRFEKLEIVDAGLTLVVYHARPGTDSARALALLKTIAA